MTTTPTTPVTGVDFVTVPTQDLAAAREFYANVLGCRARRSTSAATLPLWAPSSRPAT